MAALGSGAGDGLQVRVATSGVRAYDARRKPTVNGASNGDLISSNSIWCPSVCLLQLCTLHRVPKLLSGLTRHCDDFALNDLKLRCHHWFLFDIIDFLYLSSIYTQQIVLNFSWFYVLVLGFLFLTKTFCLQFLTAGFNLTVQGIWQMNSSVILLEMRAN